MVGEGGGECAGECTHLMYSRNLLDDRPSHPHTMTRRGTSGSHKPGVGIVCTKREEHREVVGESHET